jgi:hypothetical protein
MSCLICEIFISEKVRNQVCLLCTLKGKEYISKKIFYNIFENINLIIKIFFIDFFKDIKSNADKIKTMGTDDQHNLAMMAELDIKLFHYQKLNKLTLQDLPLFSRFRLKVEFLFLNYYTLYQDSFRDQKNMLITRNNIMDLSSYIFDHFEFFDLNPIFGCDNLGIEVKSVSRRLIFSLKIFLKLKFRVNFSLLV